MKVFSFRKLDEVLSDPRVRPSGIAKVAKIASSTLSEIRNGRKEPKINTLAAVAQALNKTVDYFLEEETLVSQQHLMLEARSVANG